MISHRNGRQAAQINLSAIAAAAVGNGAGRNVETIIVSGLEFVGLQRHPAYKREPDVRELEGVAPEVSGSLKREGENIVVISESKGAARAQRFAEIRAKTVALFAAHDQTNNPPPPVEQALEPQSE